MNCNGGEATLNTAYGSATNYNRLTVAAGGSLAGDEMTLKVETGADAIFSELRVGHGNSSDKGKNGNVIQTGGTLSVDKLQLGYYGTRTAGGSSAIGRYTISSGTLQAKAGSSGKLMVGTGITTGATSANNEGIFTVKGSEATVSMTELYVGGAGGYVGTGTLAFQTIDDSGVSPITVSSTVTLDAGGASSVAKLDVRNTGEYLGTIILVQNTGTSLVTGLFDTVNGVAATEGAEVTIAGGLYTLHYDYDADGDDANNDIALIPEPATIALLTLGLIAIRRKK
jgi:hypothetical protein